MLHKLTAYGVIGPILNVLESFLQERSLKVVLDSQSSSHITNAGVPQRSVLGPTLFLVFINDLPDKDLSRIGTYADDSTLYSPLGKSVCFFEKVESAGELEFNLCSIVEWGARWLVTFNATETKLLSFNRHLETLFCCNWH